MSRVQAVNTSFRVCVSVSVCVMVVGGGVGELQTPGLDVKASCREKNVQQFLSLLGRRTDIMS